MSQYVNSNVFKKINKKMNSIDIRNILFNFNETNDNHTSKISNPTNGDVYLFHKPGGAKDYLVDGWKWVNQSKYCKDQIVFSYYKSESGIGDSHFRKRVVKKFDADLPVLIEYLGNDEAPKSSVHGSLYFA